MFRQDGYFFNPESVLFKEGMPASKRLNKQLIYALIFVGAGLALFAGVVIYRYFQKKEEGYYTIGIILSSVEVDPQNLKVIKFIIEQKIASVNSHGGILNRRVKTVYLNDQGNLNRLHELVQTTSKDSSLIAYIGCKGTSRAQKIGPLLAEKKIPFIARYVLTSLMKRYPNAYSSEIDISDLEVVLQNLLLQKAKNVAFIGMRGDLYTIALLQGLNRMAETNSGFQVTTQKWFGLNDKFIQRDFDVLADSIKHHADFLVLSAEPEMFNTVLQNLWKRGVDVPVYCGLTDILQLNVNSAAFIKAELYDINAFGVPGVQNMRIFDHLDDIPSALKPRRPVEFEISIAGRLADEIGLLQEAAADKTLPGKLNIRDKINLGLQKYVNSEKIYRGEFSDWSFTAEHGFAGDALLSWKPRNYDLPLLAPMQFQYNDSSQKLLPDLPVLYTNLDLEEISQVNDEEGSFYASFYLDLSSAGNLTFKDIDFANAARNKIDQEPLVDAKLIRAGRDSVTQAFTNYLYKVSGRFFFNPDLKRYPFDSQKFTIKLQQKNALKPFLVQPPNVALRDTNFLATGWNFQKSFVGYDQEIISIENDFSSLQQNIPAYSFSFVYMLKRAKVDFSLKVLVPLLALLIVSYFSVYIPRKEFEAMAGIQVTALLAAIALYFSTYKPDMQYATTADKIFIFTYIMITSLIATSIYRYIRYHFKNFYTQTARVYQIFIFPAIVIAFTLFMK